MPVHHHLLHLLLFLHSLPLLPTASSFCSFNELVSEGESDASALVLDLASMMVIIA